MGINSEPTHYSFIPFHKGQKIPPSHFRHLTFEIPIQSGPSALSQYPAFDITLYIRFLRHFSIVQPNWSFTLTFVKFVKRVRAIIQKAEKNKISSLTIKTPFNRTETILIQMTTDRWDYW